MCCFFPARKIIFNVILIWMLMSVASRSAGINITEYDSHTWQTDDGLPQSFVLSVAQTEDGYIWAGTREGLARFDGVNFVVFTPQNTPALKDKMILSLCAGKNNVLWIGTERGGMTCLKDGVFTHFSKEDGLPGNAIRTLFEDSGGGLWVGTASGLGLYKGGKFSTFTVRNGLAHNVVRQIFEEGPGEFGILTALGLDRWRNGVISPYQSKETFSSFHSVCRDHEGSLWFGANGLIRIKDDKVSRYVIKDGLTDNDVTVLSEDRRGNLWIGTSGGLQRWIGGRLLTETSLDVTVFCLVEDREGNIWVGSKSGLTRLAPRRFQVYTKQQGLSHNATVSVLEDHSGDIWIGTYGGGLNRLKNGNVFHYSTTTTRGFPHDSILALHEGRDGSLWFGTDFGTGMARWKDGTITRYWEGNGLADPAVSVIHEDRKGDVWVATRNALYRLAEGAFLRYSTTNGLAGNKVNAILEDKEGALWFGTHDGLSHWQNGKFENIAITNELSSQAIQSLYEDHEGNIWIGTLGGGLNRFSRSSSGEHIAAYTHQEGLFSDQIFSVLEDDYGYLWMSCFKGIFRVKKTDFSDFDHGRIKKLHSLSYDKSDGLASVECESIAQPASCKSKDGRLWFPTVHGVAVADPSIKLNEIAPPVFIEQVTTEKEAAVTATNGSPATEELSLAAHDLTSVVISPGHRELEIRYTALSFAAPEKNQFKYKLEGSDENWIEAGPRRSAHYSNLPPGKYRFHVIACNNDGVWNEHGATIGVILQPNFWQTWWFYSLMGFAALSIAAGTTRYITRKRMQANMQRLEQQTAVERERARIAQDMHDELGACVTEILLLSNLARDNKGEPGKVDGHLARISDSAQEVVRNLDGIVWAVNPENDPLDRLVGYIHEYAEQFLSATSIRCRFETPKESLPPLQLSSEERHHLFLVFKEAMNNVVKHAHATEMRVRITIHEGILSICIEDNGKGFSPKTAVGFGNGLRNMSKRTEKVGGQLTVVSEPAKGTQIKIELPLKKV